MERQVAASFLEQTFIALSMPPQPFPYANAIWRTSWTHAARSQSRFPEAACRVRAQLATRAVHLPMYVRCSEGVQCCYFLGVSSLLGTWMARMIVRRERISPKRFWIQPDHVTCQPRMHMEARCSSNSVRLGTDSA